MPAIDINRKTTNVIFDPEVSNEIITKTIEESCVMQLAGQMGVNPEGKTWQTIETDPEPDWVGETETKPIGRFTFGKRTITPYKMALIVPFSDEFRRDKGALYAECVSRVPKLFGKKFDSTVLGTTAPGTGFDVLGDAATATIMADTTNHIDVYDRFLAVDATIGAADGIMSGIALAPQGRSIVLGAKDGNGHPLFTPGVESGQLGNILGAAVSVKKGVYKAGTPAIVGIAGDWDEAKWGTIGTLTGSISDEATLVDGNSTINLWQQNMFAIRFEIEFAFMVRDKAKFVLLTNATE
jgi:HK97 family phage major capsid protein